MWNRVCRGWQSCKVLQEGSGTEGYFWFWLMDKIPLVDLVAQYKSN